MSTGVEIVDEDNFRQELQNLRADDCDTNWFLCGHNDGNPNELVCIGTGCNGVDEMASNLDDTKYMYGLVRLTLTIDMSETIKFVYFSWIGKDVPFTKRGKFGIKGGSVKLLFNPFQADFEFDGDEKDTVTEELFSNKLGEQSGTKSKVLDAAEAKDRPERGFTAGKSSGSSNSGAGNIGGSVGKQGTTFGGFNKSNAKSSLIVEDEVHEAIAALRSDAEDSVNCVCIKFQDNSPKKPLQVAAVTESISELTPQFLPEDIAFALIRVNDVVDDISTVKFAYIHWVGEKVKPMAKAKLATCSGDLEDILKPFHVKLFATMPNEVRESIIHDKVGSASGSKSNIK